MVYPAAIIGVALMVVIFMLTFVIPTFAQMFKDLGADLPLPTKIVLWLSNFVRAYILLIIAGMIGAVVRPALLLSRPRRARHHRRAACSSSPCSARSSGRSRWPASPGPSAPSSSPACRSWTGSASPRGPPGNKVVEKAVLQCRAAVTEGKTLAEPLRTSGVFPPMVTQMISVGEQTGALDAML